MSHHSKVAAGIDVSKDKLDVAVWPGDSQMVVAYTAEGLAQLDRFLKKHAVERVGFEASGGYEWRLLAHLRKKAIPTGRFQPVQVRAFAKSRLLQAKTDRLDAVLIAAFTASLEEMPPLPDVELDGLADHLTYIEQLEDRTALLKTQLETTRLPRLRGLLEKEIGNLQGRRKAELMLLVKSLTQDNALRHRFDLLTSIKGLGERTALALVVRLPELGRLSREQAAALAGVAPFNRDSGKSRGRRSIAGGRARLRKSLFMAAFAATQWNPDLRSFYQRLRSNGKAHLAAIVATMRKLVILANAIIIRNQPWTPVPPAN